MTDEFSAEVKQFIVQNVESVAQLEALILLRADRERLWDGTGIAKSLYIPAQMGAALLAELQKRGFVRVSTHDSAKYSYDVADDRLDRVVGEVIVAYRDRRVAVTSLIYSKPLNKVQTFADAFRLRKESPP
jgi:hypothetical protein